jgi:hypothetical protein
MAVRNPPYRSLEDLVKAYLPGIQEDPGTRELCRRLKAARTRGYLTRKELILVCRWKSARALGQIIRNSPARVARISGLAFQAPTETEKIERLMLLRGVGVPMASALLMLTFPRRYPVLDIRVWQLLHAMKAVNGNPAGVGFTCQHWVCYLDLVRSLARKLGVKPRSVELALFQAHRALQAGTLYGRP